MQGHYFQKGACGKKELGVISVKPLMIKKIIFCTLYKKCRVSFVRKPHPNC